MRMWIVGAGLVVAVAVGCELPDTAATNETASEQPAAGTPAAGTPASTNTAAPAASDQAEWDAISWHTSRGPACSGAVQVMTISSAEIFDDGSKIRFEFDHFPWSEMGMGHFFWWNGTTWEGGKFEWIQVGGQPVKLTQNIVAGYNDLIVPASGTPVAFAWTDESGNERSNLAKTVWP